MRTFSDSNDGRSPRFPATGAELLRSASRLPQMPSDNPYRRPLSVFIDREPYAASTFRSAIEAHGVSSRQRFGECR